MYPGAQAKIRAVPRTTLATKFQQIVVLVMDAPGSADAVIAELGCLVRGVPALHDLVKTIGALAGIVKSQPSCSYHCTAERDGVLLILAGEDIFSDRVADVRQRGQRLTFRMQSLATLAREEMSTEWALDDVCFVFFGDSGKRQNLPCLLFENVTDEIVLMQALHDNNDAASGFIVEPTEQRMIIPFVDRFAP